jgi:uncharacterized protein (TIGR02145 family)
MKTFSSIRFIPIAIFSIALISLTTCDREDRNNPWDPHNTLNPDAWAPKGLLIEDVSLTEKKINWTYDGDERIEGFQIDRKVGEGEWEVGYGIVKKNDRHYTDVQVTPDTNLVYAYRLFTFAGNNSSKSLTVNSKLLFPHPTNLELVVNSAKSIKLNWEYSPMGQQGFKIDRRVDGSDWQMDISEEAITNNSFTDTSIDLEKQDSCFYNVYAFYSEFNSTKLQISISIPEVSTNQVSNIGLTTAISGGIILNNGGLPILSCGVVWSTSDNPTVESNIGLTINEENDGSFTSSITELTPNTNYFARAYATNAVGIVYGEVKNFSTQGVPELKTTNISNITAISAVSGGTITSDGDIAVTARGVCWGTSPNPTISDNITDDGAGSGSYTSEITNLQSGITYYVRAYATNQAGTGYGNELQFTTLTTPTVSTSSITNIAGTTAISGGNVISDGGTEVFARGVCWGINQNPTIADNHTTNGSGLGNYSSDITGLDYGTIYYVRAYATNSQGTAYGEERTFRTLNFPEVTTSAISNISGSSAISGGNVINGGGGSITARGICWSTSPNPTIANSHTADGTGTGVFSSTLSSLTPNTTYYVKAYATNNAGTAYGDETSFTTTNGHPSVSTIEATEITGTTATSGGNVTSDGGFSITDRGVCWSTSPTPTIANSNTNDGTGSGSFTSNLINLSPNTTYYLRAYAKNSITTSYGNEVMFTTGAVSLPTLTTTIVTGLTGTSAVSGGNITSDGGAPVTARGVCWSTSQNPTISDVQTADGSGIGVFESNPTGFTEGVTYYLRAYATNTAGTAYGNQVSFISIADGTLGSVNDIEGNVYKTVFIGGNWWMAENLKTTKYNDGTSVPIVTDNGTWAGLSTPAYCFYNNDQSTYGTNYSALYNWYAINNQNLCPIGWHIPTYEEWDALISYTGGVTIAGGKMKSTRTEPDSHPRWVSPNIGATDEYNFSALPGGQRNYDGSFQQIGSSGYWWTSTEYTNDKVWILTMFSSSSHMQNMFGDFKGFGFSIRCIKD